MNTQGPPALVLACYPLLSLKKPPTANLRTRASIACPDVLRLACVLVEETKRGWLGVGWAEKPAGLLAGLLAGAWDRVRGQDGCWLGKFPGS